MTSGGAGISFTHLTLSLPRKVEVDDAAFYLDVFWSERYGAYGVGFIWVFFVADPHVWYQNKPRYSCSFSPQIFFIVKIS